MIVVDDGSVLICYCPNLGWTFSKEKVLTKDLSNQVLCCVMEVIVKNSGAERYGTHRGTFERNKKKIFATQKVCGICGKPVDFKQKYPHPLSACIDHIIPLAKGGHPSDIDNMQLAHWTCNRQKSDKLIEVNRKKINAGAEIVSNRDLPQSMDWTTYQE